MTRKFLFCFPLRVGNIIFGYILIVIAMAVVAFYIYELGTGISNGYRDDEKFRIFRNLESLFGLSRSHLMPYTMLAYYLSYIVIGTLFLFFDILFICGAFQANHCLVATFFTYSFFHIFLTLVLVVWEMVSDGWIQLSLIILSDLLLMTCLFSVKYLMEAIRTGNIYSRPGEDYDKY